MQTIEPLIENCPEQITDKLIEQYKTNGWLAFANVLTHQELENARQALRDLTERLAGGPEEEVEYLPAHGESIQCGARFRFKGKKCFLQLEPGYDPVNRPLEEIELKVRKYWKFAAEHQAINKLVQKGHRLHRLVEGLIGADPILFQEMALVKPPYGGVEKPWHQDTAYFSVLPLDSIIGVWIALDDAGVENGCMHVIPKGHQIGALQHFHGNDCEIVPGKLNVSQAVPVPVPAGGAMFFHGLIPHETPINSSSQRRRALQFHYRGKTSQIVDDEMYNQVFVEADGTLASCKAAPKPDLL